MAARAEHDVTRIEAFSDAVFGFAITLLVVSLEVPNSFDELLQVMKGLPVFAVTFAILLLMWQEHHDLFKRFPSSDGLTIWLNGGLLFVVLSYIYPLKFLFAGIVGPAGLRVGAQPTFVRLDEARMLMVVYGIGFAAIPAVRGDVLAGGEPGQPCRGAARGAAAGRALVRLRRRGGVLDAGRGRRRPVCERVLRHGVWPDRAGAGALPRADGALLEGAVRRGHGRKPGKRAALTA